ncbi:hypothetical protein M231_06295 [Tremella mesenterica]|uniref:Uncharacterized protein n=1 Tax=Tremella mesenterica TaxID=5217 RepID=A0A4Q1BGC0_TREME|nr:uncharacterized protein TREMEDRAFT_62556 [Tremella mesenterica DSM 1558]EIW69687.1 hypothetical protein TREMEDRAFT_62556 [Tremella mesenterica DSM 1558]RXK36451.1 hypothetical protein M231_06295 [Tremella mesenterica]
MSPTTLPPNILTQILSHLLPPRPTDIPLSLLSHSLLQRLSFLPPQEEDTNSWLSPYPPTTISTSDRLERLYLVGAHVSEVGYGTDGERALARVLLFPQGSITDSYTSSLAYPNTRGNESINANIYQDEKKDMTHGEIEEKKESEMEEGVEVIFSFESSITQPHDLSIDIKKQEDNSWRFHAALSYPSSHTSSLTWGLIPILPSEHPSAHSQHPSFDQHHPSFDTPYSSSDPDHPSSTTQNLFSNPYQPSSDTHYTNQNHPNTQSSSSDPTSPNSLRPSNSDPFQYDTYRSPEDSEYTDQAPEGYWPPSPTLSHNHDHDPTIQADVERLVLDDDEANEAAYWASYVQASQSRNDQSDMMMTPVMKNDVLTQEMGSSHSVMNDDLTPRMRFDQSITSDVLPREMDLPHGQGKGMGSSGIEEGYVRMELEKQGDQKSELRIKMEKKLLEILVSLWNQWCGPNPTSERMQEKALEWVRLSKEISQDRRLSLVGTGGGEQAEQMKGFQGHVEDNGEFERGGQGEQDELHEDEVKGNSSLREGEETCEKAILRGQLIVLSEVYSCLGDDFPHLVESVITLAPG